MNYYPEKIEYACRKANFLDFLREVWKEDNQQLSGLKISIEDWEATEEALSTIVKNGLSSLKTDIPKLEVPNTELKGIYFCLGDDARSLSIGGSLYYNEMDWTGNADFYGGEENAWEILGTLIDTLKNQKFTYTASEYIVLLFVSYILLKILPEFHPNSLIKNAGVAIGFCDGDELILGYFCDGQFAKDITLVENGEYENPASFTIEIPHFEPRGPLWEYIHWNFRPFLKEQNLHENFVDFGEHEAERILQTYPKELFINRCPKCNFIKKTPKASLCLNCGDFSSPSLNETENGKLK